MKTAFIKVCRLVKHGAKKAKPAQAKNSAIKMQLYFLFQIQIPFWPELQFAGDDQQPNIFFAAQKLKIGRLGGIKQTLSNVNV